jgi:L-iditol 2-dehydrogenase
MKAYVFHGVGKCELEDLPVPEIKEDELLIKVVCCGICGTDYHIDKGDFYCKKDTIIGHEFSGIVEKTGKNVSGFKKGDRVVGDPMTPCFHCDYCKSGKVNYCLELPGIGVNRNGAFAEYIAVPQSNVYKIQDDLSFETAALAEPLSCCLRGIDLLDLRTGENAVIIGDGPIGLLMVQLAKLAGIANILLVGAEKSKKQLALKLGVDNYVDGNEENAAEIINAYFKKAPINNIIEAVAIPKTLELSLQIASFGTKILWFGVPSPETRINIKPHDIFTKELKIMGSLMNPYTIKRAIDLLTSKRLMSEELISHKFNLLDIKEAFKVYTDDLRRIKIMIEI